MKCLVIVLAVIIPIYWLKASETAGVGHSINDVQRTHVPAAQRTEEMQKLRDEVHHFRNLAQKASQVGEAREAALMEASALIQLERRGDSTEIDRRHSLVEELKHDTNIPDERRFQLFASSVNIDAVSDRTQSYNQRLLSFAAAARQIIREFPNQRDGYDSLLRIARDSDGDAMEQIAVELTLMPLVPQTVREGAFTLLRRLDLLGKRLDADAFLESMGVVYLYTWSRHDSRSVALGARLRLCAPPGAILVAVCIDKDVDLSSKTLIKNDLNNKVLFPGGTEAQFCQRLCLDVPCLVYATDSKGRIECVSVLNREIARAEVRYANKGIEKQ